MFQCENCSKKKMDETDKPLMIIFSVIVKEI